MDEEAADELRYRQGHGLVQIAIFGAVVLPLEGDLLVVAPIITERTRSTDCRRLALLIPSCADLSIEYEKKHGPSGHISGKCKDWVSSLTATAGLKKSQPRGDILVPPPAAAPGAVEPSSVWCVTERQRINES